MNKLSDNIFSETSCPSNEVLLNYVEGKLNAIEKRRLEEHLADCDMCNDEIEGLALLNEPNDIETIVSEINSRIDDKLNVRKQRDFGFFFKIAASVILLLGLSFIIYYQVYDKKQEKLVSEAEIPPSKTLNPLKDSASAETEEEAISEAETRSKTYKNENPVPTDNLQESPTSDRTHKQRTNPAGGASKNEKSFADDFIISIVEDSDQYLKPATPPVITPDKAPKTTVDTDKVTSNITQGNATAGLPATETQKVQVTETTTVSFSGKTKNKKSEESRSAKKVNQSAEKDAKAEAPKDMEKADIAYFETAIVADEEVSIDNSIQLAITNAKNNEFQKALPVFETYATEVDKNETALFYKALSYYKLNKADKAHPIFVKLEKNKQSLLYNDVQWYYALTLIALNKKAEAIIILENIINKASPYAPQATIELEKLK